VRGDRRDPGTDRDGSAAAVPVRLLWSIAEFLAAHSVPAGLRPTCPRSLVTTLLDAHRAVRNSENPGLARRD
jgi:hypothetical protein